MHILAGRVEDFERQLRSVFETAVHTTNGGASTSDTVLLIGRQGEMRVVQNSDWTLESLAAHHGALRAFRVTREGSQVRVAARAGTVSSEISSLEEIHWPKQRNKRPQSTL